MTDEPMMTPQELATRLRVRLSWVYRHSAKKCVPREQQLPSYTLGNLLRFKWSEVEDWLERQRANALAVPIREDAPKTARSRRREARGAILSGADAGEHVPSDDNGHFSTGPSGAGPETVN